MSSDVCVLLGSRIRELRKAKGWRQIDLAQQSGIHEVHISNLERGVREVGLRHLVTLAKALDVPLPELVSGLDAE